MSSDISGQQILDLEIKPGLGKYFNPNDSKDFFDSLVYVKDDFTQEMDDPVYLFKDSRDNTHYAAFFHQHSGGGSPEKALEELLGNHAWTIEMIPPKPERDPRFLLAKVYFH